MDRFPTRCVHAGTMHDELKKGIIRVAFSGNRSQDYGLVYPAVLQVFHHLGQVLIPVLGENLAAGQAGNSQQYQGTGYSFHILHFIG